MPMHVIFGGVIKLNNISYMPDTPLYAIAYVPYSKFDGIYSTSEAIEKGTLFKALDIPFSDYADIGIMNPFCSK